MRFYTIAYHIPSIELRFRTKMQVDSGREKELFYFSPFFAFLLYLSLSLSLSLYIYIYTNLYIRLLLLIFYLLQSTVHVWPVLLSLCECSARTLYISYRSLQPSSKTPRYIFVPFLCQSFLFVSTFILFVLYNVFFSPSFYCPNYKRKRLL